jgi:hypothetical protein
MRIIGIGLFDYRIPLTTCRYGIDVVTKRMAVILYLRCLRLLCKDCGIGDMLAPRVICALWVFAYILTQRRCAWVEARKQIIERGG